MDPDSEGATRENGAMVKFHHSMGARVAPGKIVEHVNDETMLYLVGKHVAVFSYDNPTHRFILKNSKAVEIVCFCVSSNRKYVALAERMAEGGLQVNIYTQHTGSRVRSLDFRYLSKLPIVSMDFSADNKYLATVTALPDVFLYVWQVDKSRLLGMIDIAHEITKVSVSPWAYWSICTTGPSSVKLWRLSDKQLKALDPLPKRRDAPVNRFTCHAWYDDDRILAGSEEGDILVVENAEVKKTLKAVHGEGYAISSIVTIGRGFVCAGDGGVISVFERTFDDVHFFRPVKRFQSPQQARILDLSVSPKEDNVVTVAANNTFSLLSLENIDAVRDGDSQYFSQLPVGFHNDSVTAIDICVQKPLVVTGSLDKTIRVWNFMKRRTEFVKSFDEEILSLSIHPTGLRLIVGFKSYMRMYNVLSNDLHFCSEFPVKPCYEVRFSHGGHYFAAAISHRILLFNSYDFQCFGQLMGHSVTIKSFCWSKNDQVITSAELNGAVYTWQVENQKRNDNDDVRKNSSYSCVRYDDQTSPGNVLIAAMGTCRISEAGMQEGEITIRCIIPGFEPRVVKPGIVSSKQSALRKQHTAELAVSPTAQTLFVGTPQGHLLLYRWPLHDDSLPYHRIEAHSGEILFLVLTNDERHLFTVGDDNSIFMFDVEAIVEGRDVTKKPFNYSAFDDVAYVLQSDVDERVREISALQRELDDVTHAKNVQAKNIEDKYERDKKVREDESQSAIQRLDKMVDKAQREREEAEKAVVDNTRQLESLHLKAAEELEAMYTKRSEEANQRFVQLKTERDDLIVRYENRIYKLTKEQEAEKKRLEERNGELEARLTAQIGALKGKLTEDGKVCDSMLDQTILDYETEIDELKERFRREIEKKEEDLARAINNGSTGERDAEKLRKDKRDLIDQLKERDGQISQLELNVEKKKKENDTLKKEMVVRYESISAAERKIQQLKKQTTELEKLRYVLTFKFNELKKEVTPKDKQIELMTKRVNEMDGELERVALDRDQMRQILEAKEEKLRVVQKEVQKQMQKLDDKERIILTMLRELTELVADADEKRLVYQLKDVIVKYNNKYQKDDVVLEQDKTAEFERQREYMEAQLSCVKRQNKQKETNLRQENQRSTAENAILVKEINELRHEKKTLSSKCILVESQLKEARVALQRATSTTPGIATMPGEQAAGSAEASPEKQTVSEPLKLPPSRKGKLVRGPTRSLRDLAQLDSDKIAQIIAQVEKNNAEMERQQAEIQRLRDFVQHLLQRAENDSEGVTAEERMRHEEIKQHLSQANNSMTPALPPA